MAAIIQIRRDLAAQWTSVNPILANGELGLETDNKGLKIGDGATAWSSLDYLIKPIAFNAIEISPNYASINTSTAKRLIYVSADETNNGDISLYIYNGTTIKFLQTIA